MHTFSNFLRVFALLGLATIFTFGTSAHATSSVSEDSYMYVKWDLVSAGNNCSGYPARVGEIYTFSSAPNSSTSSGNGDPQAALCCDLPNDPNSCTYFGGTQPGTPDHSVCAGATPSPPPSTFHIRVYKGPGATTSSYPDYSSNNGTGAYTQFYMSKGTNLSLARVLSGFTDGQGADCGGISGLCYGNSFKNLNFDTSKCDEWVQTDYQWCSFSSAKVWIKFRPVAGCPVPSTSVPPINPAPPPVAPAPAAVACSGPTSVISGGVCTCGANYHLSADTCVADNTCSGAGVLTGGSCTCDANATANVTGVNTDCACNSGFHALGTTCAKEACTGIGALLDPAGYCTCPVPNTTKSGTAPNFSCACGPGTHDNGAGACVTDPCSGPGAVTDGNGVCSCTATSNSSFVSAGVCGCDAGYIQNGASCELAVTPAAPPPSACGTNQMYNTTTATCECTPPYENTGGSPLNCQFIASHHACDDGAGGGPPSAVSTKVGGSNAKARFANVMNQKLACCMNAFNSGDSVSKFDCVDNSKIASNKKFNDLWSTVDSDGQPNAVFMSNSAGKPITGFFQLDGTRCAEFSEFAASGSINTYRVNSLISVGQQARVAGETQQTGTIAVPNSSQFRAIGAKYKVPSNVKDYRRCPILVRAATVIQCPKNPPLPVAQSSVTIGGETRCASARAITVQMRVEQAYEITGVPLMQPFDTTIDAANNSISIQSLIQKKTGSLCPPNTHMLANGACIY
jgi:hypothetical protein